MNRFDKQSRGAVITGRAALFFRRAVVAAAALLAAAICGCGSVHYDRVALGMRPSEYERLLPSGSVRRLPGASLYFSQEPDGTCEAIVLLTNDIRLVAAKLYARRMTNESRKQVEPEYLFRAALDPALLNAGEAETGDVLRVVEMTIDELAGGPQQTQARDLVAAGLLRVMDSLPELADRAVPAGRRFSLQLLAPTEGVPECSRGEDGQLRLQYKVQLAH